MRLRLPDLPSVKRQRSFLALLRLIYLQLICKKFSQNFHKSKVLSISISVDAVTYREANFSGITYAKKSHFFVDYFFAKNTKKLEKT
jgi:hypothetical protein